MGRYRLFNWGKRSPHDEVRDRASDYLDGDAPAPLMERIRIHLDACPDCRGFVGTLRATIAAIRNLPTIEPPRSTQERINQIRRAEDSSSQRPTG